jgi:hypothetical protein
LGHVIERIADRYHPDTDLFGKRLRCVPLLKIIGGEGSPKGEKHILPRHAALQERAQPVAGEGDPDNPFGVGGEVFQIKPALTFRRAAIAQSQKPA